MCLHFRNRNGVCGYVVINDVVYYRCNQGCGSEYDFSLFVLSTRCNLLSVSALNNSRIFVAFPIYFKKFCCTNRWQLWYLMHDWNKIQCLARWATGGDATAPTHQRCTSSMNRTDQRDPFRSQGDSLHQSFAQPPHMNIDCRTRSTQKTFSCKARSHSAKLNILRILWRTQRFKF